MTHAQCDHCSGSAAVASVVIFGIPLLILIATCVLTCVVGEYLFNVVCKKPPDHRGSERGCDRSCWPSPSTSDSCMWWLVPVCHRDGARTCCGIGQNFANPCSCRPCNPADLLLRSHDQRTIPEKAVGEVPSGSGRYTPWCKCSGQYRRPSFLCQYVPGSARRIPG